MTILVTGGAGYIGSHTMASLLRAGNTVISVDNFLRSNDILLQGVQKITGTTVVNYNIDICSLTELQTVFTNHTFDAVIHFAALKSVAESVEQPFLYFQNNLQGMNNVLQCVKQFSVPHFIFSSSCSVYGNATELPVTEQTILAEPQSPYAATKQMGEQFLHDAQKILPSTNFISLRYFNPAGAHPSLHIGEITIGKPTYLVPVLCQVANGMLPNLSVFGTNLPTRDGSCVRDFIHVCDIADAHTLALAYSVKNTLDAVEVFNIGSGNGVTVMEAITAFEKINNLKLTVINKEPRNGDAIAIYADNQKAKQILNWQCKFSLEQIMQSAWHWQLKSNKTN